MPRRASSKRRAPSPGRSPNPPRDGPKARRPLGVGPERGIGAVEEREGEPCLSARLGVAAECRVVLGELLVEPAVGLPGLLRPRHGLLEVRRGLVGPSERPQRLADRVPDDLDLGPPPREPLAGAQRLLERGQRRLVLAGLGVLPAEIVEQRPEPVRDLRVLRRLREVDASRRPRAEALAVGGGERRHVRGVGGQRELVSLERGGEGRFEERTRGVRVAARAQHPPTLEGNPRPGGGARSGELLRLVDEAAAVLEASAEPFDPRELRQDLRPRRPGLLPREKLPETLLRRVEVVEVPERAEAVCHRRPLYGPSSGGFADRSRRRACRRRG
jgi:hypothetical protein